MFERRRSAVSPGSRFTGSRLWREWCFARAVFRQFRGRLLLLAAVVFGSAWVFLRYTTAPDDLAEGSWWAWLLLFGEPPSELPDQWLARTLFFLLPALGFAVILQAIVDFAFILRDRRRYERSWCRIMAKAYSNHVVLVGLGRLGYRTFLLLRQLGRPVVVIERDEKNPFLAGVRQDGSPLLVGDGRRDAVMREANVGAARSILLCTSDDLANVEMALDARSLAPGIHIVLRMFDPNLAEKIGKGLDIPVVISQSAISAPSFALRALDQDNLGSFTVQDDLIVLRRAAVSELKALAGGTVADAMERWGVTVLERTPADGQRELLPPPSARLGQGDVLVLQGTEPRLARLFRSTG